MIRAPHLLVVLAIGLVPFASSLIPAQGFVDVTLISGLTVPVGPVPTYGRGGCCADFDGDGDQDLIIATVPGLPLVHFRNLGGMQFINVSSQNALGAAGMVTGLIAGDIDNDGDEDFIAAQYGGPLILGINSGNGIFTDQAVLRGLSQIGPWYAPLLADYDRDGWLDLIVGAYFHPVSGQPTLNRIYRNDGTGSFIDVTGTTGLEDPNGLFFAGTWFDHDRDGWPDLVIANDKGLNPVFAPGSLYRNNGNGTFTDIGPSTGSQLFIDGMGVDAIDLTNSGGWEIYVPDSPPTHHLLSLDPATGLYNDTASALGIAGGPGLTGWAAHFLDADNDGWPDIHVVHEGWPNALYRNPGATMGGWVDVAGISGCAHADNQYSTIVADFDDDGRLDLLDLLPTTGGLRLLRSVATPRNWLKILTTGTASNRDGVGAEIEVVAAGITQRQHVRSGRGYLTGSDRRVHFGLGAATIVDRVTVRWPSGATQVFRNLMPNQVLQCVEPRVSPSQPPAAGSTTLVNLRFPGDGGSAYFLGLNLDSTPAINLPDGRFLGLGLDPVLQFVLVPNPVLWPTVGTLTASTAAASVPLWLPFGSQGLALRLAGLSVNPQAPWGASMIAAPTSFQIQ